MLSLWVQVTSSNGLCLYCLPIRTCFVCRGGGGGGDAFVVHTESRRAGPIIKPKPSVTLNKPIISGHSETAWLNLAALSACHWLAVSRSLVENQLYESMPCCGRRRAPGMCSGPLNGSVCLPPEFSHLSTCRRKAGFWHFCCLAF